mmetsp:Transcript_37649/g.103934  ORF Transcript_37649/g.103934 Transcript_37649/m.103934 type:complete len:214 (-) Transcript_37649:454-1095(-)|eukprot:476278-Prymnesium_polylepis.2
MPEDAGIDERLERGRLGEQEVAQLPEPAPRLRPDQWLVGVGRLLAQLSLLGAAQRPPLGLGVLGRRATQRRHARDNRAGACRRREVLANEALGAVAHRADILGRRRVAVAVEARALGVAAALALAAVDPLALEAEGVGVEVAVRAAEAELLGLGVLADRDAQHQRARVVLGRRERAPGPAGRALGGGVAQHALDHLARGRQVVGRVLRAARDE